jgi:methionyl-tRNA synthetase
MEQITIEEFFKADIRAAKIIEAEKIKDSKKLIKMQIDIGDEKRQIVAGIAEEYTAEELTGKTILVVVNLKPAKLMGEISNGMLLAASIDGRPILARFDKEVPPGTKVK